MRYTHDTWSVDLPNHWQVEETDECLAIYDPDGVGAFQVSSFFKEGGDITFEDLLEFAEVESPEKTDLPFLNGIFKKTVSGGDTFFSWWLSGKNHLVYATYICSTEGENIEKREREEIIHSLRSHHA
ncbi:DUF3805 domain-containing protein [Cocleimonas sp. KMM 6892]|uniref:DUF3805 domain-containing protein n=1 Tax=unclassified Cocleimonas TaxID=2639732 RepID=UPI002DBDCD1E|nr:MULTISPECIES: DUF3805 domain-containing protein [unclassified Cocleimonas]MEB8433371.1 DUF3805 domain-containing protein [Cocleimonas sp. KMM 6892]MEC4716182.1 DUF3805 domain-containing protein [Cocleimonas sp. KMM 6895]MEC4745925.1 DUF3805 domain-containing protein [Cocleimonas sp. KMM 6896]